MREYMPNRSRICTCAPSKRLALAIEAKDNTTHDHLRRVQVYAMEVGKELNLGDDDLEALRAAAVLHDIGKLAVPEYIISKPGKLSPEEFEKMKIHPVVGAEILEHVQFPYPVVPIVRAHHEKWNGTGYPVRPARQGYSDRRTHPLGGRRSGCARLRPAVSPGAAIEARRWRKSSRTRAKLSIPQSSRS